MLKKTLTYEDYNGTSRTEEFFFHMTNAELVELQLSEKKGFAETMLEIISSNDGNLIIQHFKSIVLMAYGKKSTDGKRFIKTQELRDEFSQTEAYSMLFVELATDADAASAFIRGIIPAGMAEEVVNVELPPEIPPAPFAEEPAALTAPPTRELTDEELLGMSPLLMSREELQRAMRLKNLAV